MGGRAGFLTSSLLVLVVCGCGGTVAGGVDPAASLVSSRSNAQALLRDASAGLKAGLEQPAGAPALRALLHDDGIRLDLHQRAAVLGTWLDRLTDPGTLLENTSRMRAYRVATSALCGDDSACSSVVSQHVVRSTVTSPELGSIDIDLTADGASLGTIRLRPDRIEVEANLSVVARAISLLEGNPVSGSGRLLLALSRSAGGFDLRGSALDPVALDDGSYGLLLAAADPFVQMDFDGHGAGLSLSSGPLEINAPLSSVLSCEDCKRGHRVGLAAAGFTGSIRLSGPTLSVDSVGLGNGRARALLDGAGLLAVDLNDIHGRTVTGLMAVIDGSASVAVESAFDLQVVTTMEPMLDAGVHLPDWSAHENLRVELADAGAPSIRFPLSPAPDEALLEVVDGNLSLRSASDELQVPAGLCLIPTEGGLGPFSGLSAGNCR